VSGRHTDPRNGGDPSPDAEPPVSTEPIGAPPNGVGEPPNDPSKQVMSPQELQAAAQALMASAGPARTAQVSYPAPDGPNESDPTEPIQNPYGPGTTALTGAPGYGLPNSGNGQPSGGDTGGGVSHLPF
jgi:hypothetical protein